MNWDYIAGFFDGEGCVVNTKDKRRAGSRDSVFRLTMGSTHKPTLEEIHQFLTDWGMRTTIIVNF